VTDQQLEALESDPATAEVEQVLLDVGFRPEDQQHTNVVCQSQETVDRDCGGSWFYAMR
jgi:hypothetical protein